MPVVPEFDSTPAAYRIVAGAVRTMNPEQPTAAALALRGDRIVAVGSLAEATAACPVGTPVEDFGDATILPGFTDAHLHMQRGGLKLLLEMGDAEHSLDDFIAVMNETGLKSSPGDDVEPTMDARLTGLRRIQPLLHSLGFTGIIDPAATDLELAGYERAYAEGVLTMRVLAMPYPNVGDADNPTIDAAIERLRGVGIRTGFGDDMLRIGGIKIYFDGEGMKGEALLPEPWPESGEVGVQRIPTADFEKLVEFCAANGWSVGVHAVGGAASAAVVRAFEKADAISPIAGRQWQVIHAYLETSDDTMTRAAAIGAVASVQASIALRNAAGLVGKLGSRAERVNPLRSWIDSGAVVALGSDGPFFPFDPRELMWSAITRRMRGRDEQFAPDEAITAEEALRGYTVNSAIAAFAGDRRGRLVPGWLADFTVSDADPLAVEPEQLLTARTLHTTVGGRTVFTAATAPRS
ncbi:amidohydrolase [Subtercola endophyticus]|uniref:amidohydrolase n=1 Tax=Subtercola endophyticus TaxID=2895559 RepID=UPI001E35E01D|nr:amidohydrolase family protein [Subtercola endophyticus]UFS58676.1 amidohydrolase family protein [Subtercola endophyticus]